MEDDNKKVEGTEEKPKSLIDRFWWVIPPVFLTFVYWPLLYGQLSQMSFELYVEALRYLFIGDMDVGIPKFFWAYILFGPMAVGMLWIRRLVLPGWTREGVLIMRIIVPIIFGILGHFIGIFYFGITSDFFLD